MAEKGRESVVEEMEKEGSDNPFVSKFESFFKQTQMKPIERLVEKYPEKRSLFVDFTELEHFDYELADELLENPDYVLEAAETAIQRIDVPALDVEEFKPHVRFFGVPKEHRPFLRDIGAAHIGKLITIEGVIKQITEVMPKLKVATWECRRCGNKYTTYQSSQQIKSPSMCQCKHRDFALVTESSTFVDFQKIQIQEPIELLKGSEQPTNVDIHVTDDLVNKVAPGDKINITGVIRLYPPKEKKIVYGRFLEAIHLEETAREFEEVEISKEEEAEIRELSKDKKVYDMLTQSLAPAIYGHETVKEAIVLQLFGGVRKVLPEETKIRGNIHVLLVGDPGAAKSMLLLATNRIAPKSIYVAGKSASGAGISATAVKDEFGEGGWTIKAGALVLASGGLAAIDEFDKMEPDDRSAMHEALEQQTVSVAKAGIVTQFKTETSILAAANPKFSRFDPYSPFMQQVNLPASLISRFDLFFMIRDVLDRKKDEEIAAHILNTHHVGEMISQRKSGGKNVKEKDLVDAEKLVHSPIRPHLFKKYISFARQKIFPALSKEAITAISDFYVNLREQGRKEGAYSATHRQLEGLVRLSEASARVRLSDTVTKDDAERAIRLVRASLQDVVTDPSTGKIDIDIITSGQTHTQLNAIRNIYAIIKGKAVEMDMVPEEDVLAEAKTQGIEEEKAREALQKLEKVGDIYKPRHGFVKPTQKK
ncbi:MAG: minichromosome maintenance protein MCM [Candidatus Diapherotrites archaeon]